jgi:hypothetical protein
MNRHTLLSLALAAAGSTLACASTDLGQQIVLEVTSTDAGAALEIVKRARALLTQGQLVSSAARP